MDGIAIETETALHRTRLRCLDLKIIAKEILCKPYRHPAPCAASLPLNGFAICAMFCKSLQKQRHCQPGKKTVTQ
ncbi:hypothetical protein [Salmonella enterica]|uniref:hypothetical protein n=1 Tax=Salmonella enterica TaxID=28901 RepID=UPI001CF14B59|nr:hypothetical protein [Salmonella enterica subsp. diarizonae]